MARKIQHPGMACCDLEQDLPGWLARQRGIVEALRTEARVWRHKAEHADAKALAAAAEQHGTTAQHEAELYRQANHGMANAYAQRALIMEGHLDRVEAAHQWRPDMQAKETTPDGN